MAELPSETFMRIYQRGYKDGINARGSSCKDVEEAGRQLSEGIKAGMASAENGQPVATSRPVQQETEIEKDITKLESRMARIEELALNILTGSTVRPTGEMTIHLSREQREFIYEAWSEINAEMHGEPEESGADLRPEEEEENT